jgi:hypothetical protein
MFEFSENILVLLDIHVCDIFIILTYSNPFDIVVIFILLLHSYFFFKYKNLETWDKQERN